MLSKVEFQYSSPIDYFLYWLASFVSPIFHELGFIPNDITNMSFISFFISFYYLINNKPYLGIFFYILNFFFDCLDGYTARKYNQETVFGDWYDHITDFITTFAIISIILVKLKHKYRFLLLLIGIILFILLSIYVGCQEKLMTYRGLINSSSLSKTRNMCNHNKSKVKEMLKFLRFFGCGEIVLYLSYLLYLSYKVT